MAAYMMQINSVFNATGNKYNLNSAVLLSTMCDEKYASEKDVVNIIYILSRI